MLLLMKCHLSGVELVHVEPAAILTVELVAAVPTIVLVVADVLLVHTLAIAAVLASLRARLHHRIVNIVSANLCGWFLGVISLCSGLPGFGT